MIDKKDLLIMAYLRMNARETLTKISRKTQVPISTVYQRIRNKKPKLIIKHCAIVDFTKLGFMTKAQVLFKARQGERAQLEGFLSKHHHVNNLMKINNGYDYLAEVIFKHVQDLEAFIDQVESRFKIKKQIHYVLSDIRKEEFLADPNLLGIVGLPT